MGQDGYGRMRSGGSKDRMAHRAYFEEVRGEIPPGLTIDHLCGNRGCVNPDHLEAVTLTRNCRRGRQAKLNEADAELVRRSSLPGSVVAKLLGVSRPTVADIRAGRSWVPEDRLF